MKQFSRFRAVTLLILALVSSAPARANELYKCIAKAPRGKATLEIRPQSDHSIELDIQFSNDSSGEKFTGVLNVTQVDDEYIGAEGELVSGSDKVEASISGHFRNKELIVSLNAPGESRIDFGFGNLLICDRVR